MNRRNFLQSSCATALLPALSITTSSVAIAKPTKKVLVLGGTGFFGPVLVDELLAQGHEVTLFNRGKTNPHLFPELKKIRGDRETVDVSGLINLRSSEREWDWVVDTWQGSSKAVIDSAQILADRIGQYQYVSTVSVYDKWERIGITEDEPLNPLPSAEEPIVTENRYAIRKTFAELALKNIIPQRSVFFRSHGMRGSRTTASRHEPYWQVKIARGKNFVVPSGVEHYQVTDMVSLARFMVHCGLNNVSGAYNVCYPPILFREFIQAIVDFTDSPVKLHWIPQEFLLENDVQLIRNEPAGRYRFNVDKALNAGLINRPLEQLFKDQLQGYRNRNPNDNFLFGKPETKTISTAREAEIIRLWQSREGR